VAIKLANYIWGGLLFLDHRRLLGVNPLNRGKTKKPPQWWGKALANIMPIDRAGKTSPIKILLFFFLDNADT